MRRRLVRNTILVSVMVLAVLATPVVLLLKQATEEAVTSRLDATATAISNVLANDIAEGRTLYARNVANIVEDTDRVDVFRGTEALLTWGPVINDPMHRSVSGPLGTTIDVSTSSRDLTDRLTRQFLLLGVLAAGGVLLAAVLAAIFGARLTRPLEQLAASAGRLGAGDFSAALPPPSGIPEIDDIRSTLSASATRLDQTLSSERSFTGDATHQLRTGLTGIALQLQLLAMHDDENVKDEATQALNQTDRLTATLDELLDLARGGRGSQRMIVHLHDIALEHRGDWMQRYHLRKRNLLCSGSGSSVVATPGFVGQIIDILIDNALNHGRGDVRIDVSGRQLQISDEGIIDEKSAEGLFRGSDDPAAPHGRGLALSRRLAQADGGRLELVSRAPATFVLTFPAAHPT
ncbi:MAG: HAMP domain-containing sensor histidine kinase [Ilumatobacteraceae bacterium]